MIKKFIIFLLLLSSYASQLEIHAKNFEYNQTSNISKFIGDVNVTRENDNILSDSLFVYLTKDKKLNKLIAIGNVKFKIKDKNTTYIGSSHKITYLAIDDKFIFNGKVHITQLPDNQQLFGNIVIIDKKNGNAFVKGQQKKPMKFIIKVKD